MKSDQGTVKGTGDGEKGQLMAKRFRRTRNEIGPRKSERYRRWREEATHGKKVEADTE